MNTEIIQIEEKFNEKGDKLTIVKFMYTEKLQFTYLTQKSLEYWFNKNNGQDLIKVGSKINVFKVPDTKYYKIVKFLD